jgi:hypothetical protein
LRDVKVEWTTESVVVPNAETADHYVVGLGTTEVNVAKNLRSHTFIGVPAGSYQGWVVLVNAQGVQLHQPVMFDAVVLDLPPETPPAMADVPVSVTVSLV